MARRWIKYLVNERFFDEWTAESAYVVGWILGDGCTGKRCFDIYGSLAEYEHIKNIARVMGSTHKVVKVTASSCRLRIGRIDIVERLRFLGIADKIFPLTCGGCERHVVRGYFDSDGCVQWNKGCRSGRFKLVSVNIKNLFEVKRVLLNVGICCHVCISGGFVSQQDYGSLVVSSPRFQLMYDFLYGGGGLYLERKKEIADQILKVMLEGD